MASTTDSIKSPTASADEDEKGQILSGGDLVKVLEITLAEIRITQRFAVSVLAFDVACSGVILNIHDPAKPIHFTWTLVLGIAGIIFSLVGAGLIGYAVRQHLSLEQVILSAEPGKSGLVLKKLRGALSYSLESAQLAHKLKVFLVIGFLMMGSALVIELSKCRPVKKGEAKCPTASQ